MTASAIVGQTADSTTKPAAPPEGSGIRFFADALRWRYIGTREALLAAGIVPAGVFFPGDRPGRPSCGFEAPGGRQAKITKTVMSGVRSGLFLVAIYPNREEDERRIRREELARATAEAQALQNRLSSEGQPQSAPELRGQAAQCFWGTYVSFLARYAGEHGKGFMFSNAAIGEFTRLARAFVGEIAGAEVVFDPARRDRRLTEAWLKCARLDQPLQELLKAAIARAAAGDAE